MLGVKKPKMETTAFDTYKRLMREFKSVKAREYLKKAALVDENPEALCYYAVSLNRTNDNEADITECFKKAADLGSGWGMWEYASSYFDPWFEKAYKSGDPYAVFCCLKSGQFSGKMREILGSCAAVQNKRVENALLAAESGNMYCQVQLAHMYMTGDIPCETEEERRKNTFKWFLEAAKQSHPYAQLEIARIFWEGDQFVDVEKNLTTAYEWFRRAEKSDESCSRLLSTRVFDNFELHRRARRSLLTLICIRQYKKCEILAVLPLDIVKMIAMCMWNNTRNNECWKKRIIKQ